jgi:CBS domain-containing protein
LIARDVMRRDGAFVPAAFSLENTLLTLDRYDANALPVIDAIEGFRGMVSRADVVAALGGQVRPPVVGGMATPLGVWLTTGTVNGGAPNLACFFPVSRWRVAPF